jgi:DNA-binding transcriptional MerR regulator
LPEFDSFTDTVYNVCMADVGDELSIEELADRAGVSVRTVRYYISEGLLAGPRARGRNASYSQEHLARLRLIRRLVEQHVPLADLRQKLTGLSHQQVKTLLEDEERHGTVLHRASSTRSPADYIGELLTRARTARSYAPPPVSASAPASPSPGPAHPNPALASTNQGPAVRGPQPAPQLPPRPDPETWQHLQLAPGLELHVRAGHAAQYSQLIERLLETAREAQVRDR